MSGLWFVVGFAALVMAAGFVLACMLSSGLSRQEEAVCEDNRDR